MELQHMDAVVPPFDEYVRTFNLPPIVPIKRACEIAGCGHSKLYEMGKQKTVRIVKRAGGSGSGVPAIDLYKLYIAALS
jgi:hypothetical protein